MFREMRRKNQQLSETESAAVLERGTSGVLAVLGDGGYPYGVPVSYAYCGGKIYFHCAKSGHKLDAIRNCERGFFLRYRSGSGGSGKIYHLLPQRDCFWTGQDPGGRQRKEGGDPAADRKILSGTERRMAGSH